MGKIDGKGRVAEMIRQKEEAYYRRLEETRNAPPGNRNETRNAQPETRNADTSGEKTRNACVVCGEPVPKPKRGPVGKYCGSPCRQRAYRARAGG